MYIIEKSINNSTIEVLRTSNLEEAIKTWCNIPEWKHYWDSEQQIIIDYVGNTIWLQSFMELYDDNSGNEYFYYLRTL